jgi:hypothetical protein
MSPVQDVCSNSASIDVRSSGRMNGAVVKASGMGPNGLCT